MLEFSQSDIDSILAGAASGSVDSNLGYFSKPFRINLRNKEFIFKRYAPLRDINIPSAIIENHGRYIEALKKSGINLPGTFIGTYRDKGRSHLYIIQEAFQKNELLRTLCEISEESELLRLCKMILDDAVKFWQNRPGPDIGFHPTLRNYALQNERLYYFDTFPPMLMSQRELNKIILKMSPYGSFVKRIVPLKWINLVSDEYYNFTRMFTGITGSCCRLRNEHAGAILKFSTEYINDSSCTPAEKQEITTILQSPPELPAIWTFFRRISGNVGKPNIKKART
jgi:hypothetical protein